MYTFLKSYFFSLIFIFSFFEVQVYFIIFSTKHFYKKLNKLFLNDTKSKLEWSWGQSLAQESTLGCFITLSSVVIIAY